MKKSEPDKGEIIIYQTSKKEVELKVRLKHETIWLSQAQIAKLFGTQRPAVTKHLGNICRKPWAGSMGRVKSFIVTVCTNEA